MIISTIPLLAVSTLSDLPIWIGNWIPKIEQILQGHIPESNFWPIGSTLMLLPFYFLKNHLFFVIIFYYVLGNIFFYKLTKLIKSNSIRRIVLYFSLLNVYLPWLAYSSQDTVFEYFLLMITIWFLTKNKFGLFTITGFLLCLCRPSYWLFFLLISLIWIFRSKRKNKIVNKIHFLPVFLLLFNSTFNYLVYDSISPAQESGITSYFSYNKYLYLSLPLFDMDVFLAKGGHMNLEGKAGVNSYQSATLDSIKTNPKEIILAQMQKVDSYVFSSQKSPKLPGEYFLSEDAKTIIIGNERITWPLVIGAVTYQIYRGLLFLFFLFSLGILYANRNSKSFSKMRSNLIKMLLPWLTTFAACFIYYTETRFKIVSETLLSVVIGIIFTEYSSKNKRNVKSS